MTLRKKRQELTGKKTRYEGFKPSPYFLSLDCVNFDFLILTESKDHYLHLQNWDHTYISRQPNDERKLRAIWFVLLILMRSNDQRKLQFFIYSCPSIINFLKVF